MSQNSSGKRQQTITIVAIVLLLLVGGFAVMQMNQVSDLEDEKTELIGQLEQLKSDLDAQTTANDSLTSYIASETARLESMIADLESQNGDLKSKVATYRSRINSMNKRVFELSQAVDSTNAAYAALQLEKDSVDANLSAANADNASLTAANSVLSSQVADASVLRLSAVSGEGFNVRRNGNEKSTRRARRVSRVKGCFTVQENPVASKGKHTAYLRVETEDGRVLTGKDMTAIIGGQKMMYTATQEIEFNGQAQDYCLSYDVANDLAKGVYTVKVYIDGYQVGAASMELK